MKLKLSTISADPLYVQLKSGLVKHIVKNKMKPGDPLPKIQDIAESAGVGLETAYKALNLLIKEGHCFRRPKSGTFVSERSLPSRPQVRDIACIYIDKDSKTFAADIIDQKIQKGIQHQMEDKGILSSVVSQKSLHRIDEYHSKQSKENLLGVLVLSHSRPWDTLELAKSNPNLNFVFLNYYFEDFEFTPENVTGLFNDEYAGGFQIAQHLLSLGCRKTGVINIENKNYSLRLKGVLDAFAENGVKPTLEASSNLIDVDTRDFRKLGWLMTERLLSENQDKFDSIITFNDFLAQGAHEYLVKVKLRDKIRVTGYDNIDPHVSIGCGFSTVSVDFEGMGSRAVKILLSRKKRLQKQVKIAPQLLIRKYQHA